MRWWKQAARGIAIIALGTFAALWALTEADVLRWGAGSAIHDRIEALEDQASAPAEWIVVADAHAVRSVGGGVYVEGCFTYTSPGGVQETCRITSIEGEPPSDRNETQECYESARIGDPLPDCWR